MQRQPSSQEFGLIRGHGELEGGGSGLCHPLLYMLCMAGFGGLAYMWQSVVKATCMLQLAFAAVEICSLL